MFFHIFKYRLLLTLRDKMGLFWSILFPIILSTFFFMAFTNILNGETFQTIDVAVINETEDTQFVPMLESTNLCNITITDADNAQKLLDEGKISGIINLKKPIRLSITQNGINQSILKNVIDAYQQTISTVNHVVEQNPEALKTDFLKNLNEHQTYTKEKPIGTATNTTVIFFYALISMTAIIGGTQAIFDIEMTQADQSATAARVNVAPTHKLKALVASLSCSILTNFAFSLLTLAYMGLILKIEFGKGLGYIILLMFVGCFTGVMLGAMCSSFIKKTGIKIGVIVSYTELGSFLAGLMAVNMKYWVQSKAPLLAYINPVNLITDGFYSLYYYGLNQRYFINLFLLVALGVLSCFITYFKVRGKKYANI